MRALEPGVVVDGFRLTRLVAEGSMGSVFLAVDERLGRRLALKFLRGFPPDAGARFADEARTTARFNHPHIVTVYAAGMYGEMPYLALEYVDGPTLRERIAEQGRFSAPEAMRIARAIAEALTEAHQHDVVHADLKPENVILGRDGRLRVVDFGLSRLSGGESTAASGTPAYMAPERWLGKAPNPAIDVWSLGVLLAELIEGRRPWNETEVAQLAYSPTKPPLGALVTACPCSALVAACLQSDPASRPTAQEVMATLEWLILGTSADDGRSPFRGLEAFSERDAKDFHGRADDIEAALERLRVVPLLPIVGPSGVGKSSFVFAGLVPRLRESAGWETRVLRPGRRPWSSLAAALGCDAAELAASPGAVVSALRAIAQTRRVMLVIDQFEELVTLGDEETKGQVLRALALAASPEEPWRIVCTLRSDFLPAFASAPELASALEALFVLRPLSREALREAIEAPLRRVTHRADDAALPHRIAAELDGHVNALPLLQFACQELWNRRDAERRLILAREYDVIGGAVGALASHAQRVVEELPQRDRSLVRDLLLRLVNTDGTRRPRTREEVLSALPAEAPGVLDRLLRERLLVASHDDDTQQPLVELAHEALVTAWPQLSRWLTDSHEARALAQEIEGSASTWDRRGRRAEETWRGEALADAVRRVQSSGASLTTLSRAFLEAGSAREVTLGRRRRTLLSIAFVGVSLLALIFGVAALAFREKEREAIAQQKQIRLAAGDYGRFTLVLEPFDWDANTHAPVRASAPDLQWSLHAVSKTPSAPAGAPLSNEDVLRDRRRVVDGSILETVETRAGAVVFKFERRGRDGDSCGPSWQVVQELPGYNERGATPELRLKVPTCQASRADRIRIPPGPFFRSWKEGEAVEVDLPGYFIDRTEFPMELTAQNFNDPRVGLPPRKVPPELGGSRTGVATEWVDAVDAQRLCAFLGRRLPTADEWQKAARGGRWLDDARTVANPLPRRVTPWGDARTQDINVQPPSGDLTLFPVGSSARDVSPYGVRDLGGGVSEWTATDYPFDDYVGMRVKLGSSIAFPDETWGLDRLFVAAPFTRAFGIGFRCASE